MRNWLKKMRTVTREKKMGTIDRLLRFFSEINRKIVFGIRTKGSACLESAYRRMPERFLGKKEDWRIRFYAQYGVSMPLEQIERLLNAERKKLMYRYFAAIIAGTVFFAGTVIFREIPDLSTLLVRPEYREASRRIPLTASVRWRDEEVKENITLTIGPRRLGSKETERLIMRLADSLPERILGENESLRQVSKRLNLFTKDEETGILLRWFSERPERIREDGFVDAIGVRKPEPVMLKAELTFNDLKKRVPIQAVVVLAGESEIPEEALKNRINQAAAAAESLRGGAAVALPENLGDGITAEWSLRKEGGSGAAVPILCLILCLCFFRMRYSPIDRAAKSRRETMHREFPELVNQFVLLLNAGLVSSAAFFEIADSAAGSDAKTSPLFYELSRMAERVRESNTSFVRELAEFSHGCGLRELVRFSSIIADNVDKGSSLAEKLEREGELLRDQQKRLAEERGRLAETKLSLPLMILLLVLVVIAVAPVMFEL